MARIPGKQHPETRMSPEVAAVLRKRSCVCGAQPGELCIAQPSGKRTDHVHQNRAFSDLFRQKR